MVKNHVHTYRRSRLNKKTYQCTDPGCTHFARKELITGKYAICPDCNETYILTHDTLDLATPRCDKCRGKSSKKAASGMSIEEFAKFLREDKKGEDETERTQTVE